MEPGFNLWLSLTRIATSGKVAGGAFIAAVLVAIAATYLAVSVWAIPAPIAASGPVLILISAAAWRYLAGATLPRRPQTLLAVMFMSIVLLSMAAFLGIMLVALARYVNRPDSGGAAEADLTLEEITSFLNDRSPETIAEYREGARRHSYQMVSNDVPITGNAASTASRTQSEYDYALADAGSGMVKITALPLAPDAQYVNGTSNRGHPIAGAAFEANVAAYVIGSRGEPVALRSVDYNASNAWFVPQSLRTAGNLYCQIAYYAGTHLFEVDGDLIWIETTSIAGRIGKLNFSLKGAYSSLMFRRGYAVVPGTPPRFSRLVLDRIVPATEPTADVQRCAGLFRDLSPAPQPWLTDALAVWDAPQDHSIQFQVVDVTRDTLVVVEGSAANVPK